MNAKENQDRETTATVVSETVQALAKYAVQWFETAHRGDDPEKPYTRLGKDAPKWISDMIHDAHSDMFPDDWKYDCIADALSAIAENDDPEDFSSEFADNYVDIYNSERVAWLASHGLRAAYCSDAAAELGTESHDVIELIGLGQYFEASEVYGIVLQDLEKHLRGEDI